MDDHLWCDGVDEPCDRIRVGHVAGAPVNIAANRKGAELLVGIGEAVSAADGEMEPAEEARIGEIRRLLNVGNGDDAEG
jgi:hypothetical protein